MKAVKQSVSKLESAHIVQAETIRLKLEAHDKQDDKRFLALVAVLMATSPPDLKKVVAELLQAAQ